ncbi:serine/threonine-protein kinase [Microbispora amethystogenes]|uniref:non-specific serine/threonine protein kinase n=1 Tax=Microbispora amethystogenes TaxID=1427754 RepID=A0ABQ4FN75_9ACTN|nr:serine/threonine-protein kinase [Microbispora amethystogenes]GIH36261.1 protein kinase [Microbispora amethystogenes]
MATRTIIDGRYELDPFPIGRGGYGEVRSGYDTRLDRRVAVKFIRVDRLPDGKPDEELTKRFVRECRITARLEHPGVPIVYDHGTYDGELYLVMQLIEGSPVSTVIDELERLPVGWAAAIGAQVCTVLSVAHTASLVHRDLKPGNLMLCPDGTVKVLDFGVAGAYEASGLTRITQTGVTTGTPEYMAPEQAFSAITAPQSDLYSLGVVLYELLTGERPFTGPTPLAVMRGHTDETPRPLRQLRPEIPARLEALVLRLLSKRAEDRPEDAAEVFAGLTEFCRDLPPLPGFVDVVTGSPVLMYASVVARIPHRSPAPAPEVVGVPVSNRRAGAEIRERDISHARADAQALLSESRFGQAASVLAAVIEPAGRALGAASPEVISLRLDLANVLFLGGDYRRAAPEFNQLAADLAVRDGDDNDLVLRCRLQEAACHANVGETSLALRQLRDLLVDEREFGVDEDRILELRREIGLLELAAGDKAGATRTLSALLPDLERRYGPRHPGVDQVVGILADLDLHTSN